MEVSRVLGVGFWIYYDYFHLLLHFMSFLALLPFHDWPCALGPSLLVLLLLSSNSHSIMSGRIPIGSALLMTATITALGYGIMYSKLNKPHHAVLSDLHEP